MSTNSVPMAEMPRLQLIDGGQDQLASKVLSLIISPDTAAHEGEIERLMSILQRRGNLSVVNI